MKDRIAQIMKSEDMTQQDFAAALDISPSTLSSIFNDRTQPSLAIVNKIHDRFPSLNLLWLLYGQGEMYHPSDENGQTPEASISPRNESASVLGENGSGNVGEISHFTTPKMTNDTTVVPVAERVIEKVKYIDKPPRRITEINVYFDDGTYEVFVPRKKE